MKPWRDNQHLFQPLIHPSTTTTVPAASSAAPLVDDEDDGEIVNKINLISSNSSIVLRLLLITTIGLVSIWANHQASQGFAVTVVDDAGDTPPGKRFHLFYVSNDKATRLVIRASEIVENFLYPKDDCSGYNSQKQVNQVVLKLSRRELNDTVDVKPGEADGEFILLLNPSVLEDKNFNHGAVFDAVLKGLARVWLWDGEGSVPQNIVNGIIEYIIISNKLSSHTAELRVKSNATSAKCSWKQNDPKVVAELLNHGEALRPGFIRRLNRAMKDGWKDEYLDNALGMPAKNLGAMQ